MKFNKTIAFTIICVLSAYLSQRALAFMLGETALYDTLGQQQMENQMMGVSLSFTYLGMNIYWPLLMAIAIAIYPKASAEKDVFYSIYIQPSRVLELFTVIFVPFFAVCLHILSIHEVLEDYVEISFQLERDGWSRNAEFFERISSNIYLVMMALSILVFSINGLSTLTKLRAPNKSSDGDGASTAGS